MELKIGDTHVEIAIQHLEYAAIIGGRRISPHSILKIAEGARAMGDKIYERILGSHSRIVRFLKWQQVEIFPEFYNDSIDPTYPLSYFHFINRKMKNCHSLFPIGNTSQMMEDVVVDYVTEIPLFTVNCMSVNIDPKSRRPASFPDALKKHFTAGNRITTEKIMPRRCVNLYECVPADGILHVWECAISIRAIDRNNHANQASYVDICYDCLGDAFAKSVFGKTDSLLAHDIRRISILYLKEMSLGDKARTTVWKDQLDSPIHKFHIKRDSVIVCQAEIELYHRKLSVKSNL